MNIPVKHKSSAWRYLWLLALIGLPVLGWHGVLDQFSAERINSSISSAGLIYGTARGINALVSLLQGTELNVPFLTFSIGEVLDPVNDLIERFSEVILLALGSLALQKILLAVVSATMFNILLSVVAICTGLALLLNSPKLLSTLLRTFLIVAFFRFSLGLVVLANSWVDSTFLDKADQQRHLAMENFQGELREIDTLGQNQKEAEAHIREVQQSLFEHERIYGETKAELDILDRLIAVDDKNLKTLIQAAGGLCTTWDVLQRCPDKVKNAKIELDDKKKTRSALADELEALRGKLVDQRDEIACAEKRQRGENCKFWDRLPDTPNIALVQQKLNDLNTSVSDFAENTINLLVSLLLKTVAIPLVFIYLLLMIVRMNWKRV
jgi:hypothetical protein